MRQEVAASRQQKWLQSVETKVFPVCWAGPSGATSPGPDDQVFGLDQVFGPDQTPEDPARVSGARWSGDGWSIRPRAEI